uniref:Uncharacterized protein n=1 Tax=Tetranychus urticae TaxID=32264 RepID=T1KD63_TETUR
MHFVRVHINTLNRYVCICDGNYGTNTITNLPINQGFWRG